jgi:hypothetical protein
LNGVRIIHPTRELSRLARLYKGTRRRPPFNIDERLYREDLRPQVLKNIPGKKAESEGSKSRKRRKDKKANVGTTAVAENHKCGHNRGRAALQRRVSR